MAKEKLMTFRLGFVSALVLFMACLFHSNVRGMMENEGSALRVGPDVIRITVAPPGETSEMPAALFFHDRHTAALKDAGCNECHQKKEDGRLAFKFKGLTNTDQGMNNADKETAMALYHDGCIGCHQARKDQGQPTGPMAVDCRACHRNERVESSWVELPFDKSLHHRHVASKNIAATVAEDDRNCSACHHEYDRQTQKLYYEKGKEGSCQYCHMEVQTDTALPFKTASHDACLNCHQRLKDKKIKAGPVICGGCHGAEQQNEIATIAEVPRLKRNQPNATILAANAMMALKDGKQPDTKTLAVAFDHNQHEAGVSSCRTCHHASLDACRSCHTPSGVEKGQYVRLEQAMHNMDSVYSCTGCHDLQKNNMTCAGCHSQMPAESFANEDCASCHNISLEGFGIDKGLDSPLLNEKMRAAKAQMFVEGRKGPVDTVPDEQVPETVTISVMAKEYEGATFPHRKIVKRLQQGINDSALGRYYHKTTGTLCTGCHHNSAFSIQPPKCATCHGEPFKQLDRPGLKGAYHLQCIGCHQQMKLSKPAATDCTACHVKKKTIATLSDTTP